MTIKYFMFTEFLKDNIDMLKKLSYFDSIIKIDYQKYNACIVYVKIKNS